MRIQHMFTPELIVSTDADGSNPAIEGLHWDESYSQSWDDRQDVDLFTSEHPAAVAAGAWLDELLAAGGLRLTRPPRWRRLLRRHTSLTITERT